MALVLVLEVEEAVTTVLGAAAHQVAKEVVIGSVAVACSPNNETLSHFVNLL